MSTHATPETRHASTTTEGTAGPDVDADDPAPIDPFDAHDSAGRFDDSTDRLPNTIDGENTYMGQSHRQRPADISG